MNDPLHSVLIVAVVSLVTIALRCAPFLIFGDKPPKTVKRLGTVLPYAVMGMLIVYCLKDVSLTNAPHGLPELIAGAVVIGLHLWRKNTLLSILTGTVVYMLLVQLVF